MIRITAILEISDHDGQECSGDECEYSSYEIICRTPIGNSCPPDCAKILDDLQFGDIDFRSMTNINFKNYLPIPHINESGSGHCDICPKSLSNGLYGHDFRYTIKSVIKIPLTKYKFTCEPLSLSPSQLSPSQLYFNNSLY